MAADRQGRSASTPDRDQAAERIAQRVYDAVLQLILSGQDGTHVDVPELGEYIVIERCVAG